MCWLRTVISPCPQPTFCCDLSMTMFPTCLSSLYKCVFPWFPSLIVDYFSSPCIHCVSATQWVAPYTSSSAVHKYTTLPLLNLVLWWHISTSNYNKIKDLVFETCFCNWYLKIIFHQETVTCYWLKWLETTPFNGCIFFWGEKGMEGFMMTENLNYPIS